MVTTAEKRAWLVENGHPELAGSAGKIAKSVLAEYDAAHQEGPPADDYGPGAGPGDFVAAADPGPAAGAAGEYPEPPAGEYPEPPPAGPGEYGEPVAAGEDTPQRPHRDRWRLPWHRRAKSDGGAPRPARERTARRGARLNIAPLIEDAYADLASCARGIPPLQRCLYAQAPVAGAVLDPVVAGTAGDRLILQPLARNYELTRVGLALVGTPAMLMAVLATAPTPVFEDGVMVWEKVTDQDGRPILNEDEQPLMRPKTTPVTVQHQAALVSLRYCVRAMAEVSGDALDRIRQRANENAARDDAVDAYMSYILGTPVSSSDEDTARGEGARAGLDLAGA